MTEHGAGSGDGTVSGYAISSVVWTLDSDAPREIDSVSFDVSPSGGAGSPTEVLSTVDNGSTWISCTGGPTTWTCTFGAGVIASTANPLRIVSVE
ncbi:MAG: hypothetical protein EPO32_00085 [Anaerolineae bacterium]|nr:MAG: hypothetical protein EPO32_00085 [Anaerolineae bacterium]